MSKKSKKIVRKNTVKIVSKQDNDSEPKNNAEELDIDVTSLLYQHDWKMVKHAFDLLFRSVVRPVDVAASLFESHIDSEYASRIDFSRMQCWSPGNIDQDLQEGIGDLLFIAPCKQTPDEPELNMNVSLICEHQSTVEFFMCLRVLKSVVLDLDQYLDDIRGQIRREVEAMYEGEEVEIQFRILWQNVKLPYPIVFVFFNGKRHWKYKKINEVIAIPSKFDKNILHVPTFFIDVSKLSEEELNRGMPVVRALKWSFRYEADGTLVKNYWRIFRILSEAANDPRVKKWFFQFGAFVLSRYEKNKVSKNDKKKFCENIEKYYEKVNNNPKEVKQMTTTLLREIAKHRVKRGIKRGIKIGEARGEARGEVRGEARGEARGEVRGEVRGKKEAIMECLAMRFQNPVPQDICERLEPYSDLRELDSLFKLAMMCGSLEDFGKRLT
ncbi:MAG: Rpn family recombination-promoting nuclease/putative transposase [Planctomycetaceae bacterium]|jgi:hypothetical protein|nr:Rpn family recombination-promoting nuclease/putative transposase [Planctomycetaceae bacterium]